MTSVIKYY